VEIGKAGNPAGLESSDFGGNIDQAEATKFAGGVGCWARGPESDVRVDKIQGGLLNGRNSSLGDGHHLRDVPEFGEQATVDQGSTCLGGGMELRPPSQSGLYGRDNVINKGCQVACGIQAGRTGGERDATQGESGGWVAVVRVHNPAAPGVGHHHYVDERADRDKERLGEIEAGARGTSKHFEGVQNKADVRSRGAGRGGVIGKGDDA
jgi:hypothetical protein